MRFTSLSDWLQWQENLHFTDIDPGLTRIGAVWQSMGRSSQLPFKVISVAGTNGKGSSVAITAAILRAAGYHVATYTSPHLLRYNERICINGKAAEDERICQAFQRIDKARAGISLTYFEFATLAAVDLFIHAQVDIALLEVGMGGRLDAVNLFDADLVLVTPIGLDHIHWLGDNLEAIGREKAGIIRSGKPVVLSGEQSPQSIVDYAADLGARVFKQDEAYHYREQHDDWYWCNDFIQHEHLPYPALAGHYQIQNSAAVLQICYLLDQSGMTVPEKAIHAGLQQVELAGRFQVVPGSVTRILDVTHNLQGAENLNKLLTEHNTSGRILAVLAMLRDKDTRAVVTTLNELVAGWYVAGLKDRRGLSCEELMQRMTGLVKPQQLYGFDTVAQAYRAAMHAANGGDTILIFGSFQTVEQVMLLLPEVKAVMP